MTFNKELTEENKDELSDSIIIQIHHQELVAHKKIAPQPEEVCLIWYISIPADRCVVSLDRQHAFCIDCLQRYIE